MNLRRLWYWITARRRADELAEEMEFHRAMKQQELERQGVPSEQSGSASRREMGPVTTIREDCRAVRISPWLESVWKDIAYAVRRLCREPSFSLTALAALVIGIGLNTTVFTVFEAFALRPWPVPEPDRVVTMGVSLLDRAGRRTNSSYFMPENYEYLAENARSFSGFFAMRGFGVHLAGREASGLAVSENFFPALRAPIALGSGLPVRGENAEGPNQTIVLGHNLWKNEFGADPEIIGKTIRLDEYPQFPLTVTGVAASEFTGTSIVEQHFWIPMSLARELRSGMQPVRLAGRLAQGVPASQAEAEVQVLMDRLPDAERLDRRVMLSPTNLGDNDADEVVTVLAIVSVGTLLVLLLACANIANLMLARAGARGREIATRLALGAGRRRVVRQLLTEGVVLAGIAAVISVLLSYRLPQLLLAASDDSSIPELLIQPNLTVLFFAFGVAGLACAAFALGPALHATRTGLAGALKSREIILPGRVPLRGVLLGTQVALSVTLLAACTLMVRGIQHFSQKDLGVRMDNVHWAWVRLPEGAYDEVRTQALLTQLEQALEEVEDLGPIGVGPLPAGTNFADALRFTFPGEPLESTKLADLLTVSGGYFDTLSIPILRGRNFIPADATRNVVLVNETAATRFFPERRAVGEYIETEDQVLEVVGVVRDFYTTAPDRIVPTVFQPLRGASLGSIFIRSTHADPIPRLTEILRQLDPDARLITLGSLRQAFFENLDSNRRMAAFAGGLGLLALVLAATGMFGVFVYHVEQRAREIGVRTALGAQPRQVIAQVLASGFRCVAVGLVVGLAGAVGASRLIQNQLFGLPPYDPLALMTVVVVVSAAALVASFLPARRAARVDPMITLRYE